MKDIIYNGRKLKIDNLSWIGSGGEADIYSYNDRALKIFKRPDHPDYINDQAMQTTAELKLAHYGEKIRSFPSGLPSFLVLPDQVITDLSGNFAGYDMEAVDTRATLLEINKKKRRIKEGITNNQVLSLFKNMANDVHALHRHGVVIGDFNDLNILLNDRNEFRLVDTDSMSFGKFKSALFTEKFLSPFIAKKESNHLVLSKPQTAESDMWALLAMLFEALTFTSPFGGIHKPNSGSRIKPGLRSFEGVPVWHADVMWPKPAVSKNVIGKEVFDWFEQYLVQGKKWDHNDAFFQDLKWENCPCCKMELLGGTCPDCMSPVVSVAQVIANELSYKILGKTNGEIISVLGNKIVVTEEGSIKELDGSALAGGKAEYWHILKDGFIAGKSGKTIAMHKNVPLQIPADKVLGEWQVSAWKNGFLYSDGIAVYKQNDIDTSVFDRVCDAFPGRTIVSAYPTEESGLSICHIFPGALRLGFGLSEKEINWHIVDMDFTPSLISLKTGTKAAWVIAKGEKGQKRLTNLIRIDEHGAYRMKIEDDSDLNSGLVNSLAVGNKLLVPGDEGIIRLGSSSKGIEEEAVFRNTAEFVNSESAIFTSNEGLVVQTGDHIYLLNN